MDLCVCASTLKLDRARLIDGELARARVNVAPKKELLVVRYGNLRNSREEDKKDTHTRKHWGHERNSRARIVTFRVRPVDN